MVWCLLGVGGGHAQMYVSILPYQYKHGLTWAQGTTSQATIYLPGAIINARLSNIAFRTQSLNSQGMKIRNTSSTLANKHRGRGEEGATPLRNRVSDHQTGIIAGGVLVILDATWQAQKSVRKWRRKIRSRRGNDSSGLACARRGLLVLAPCLLQLLHAELCKPPGAPFLFNEQT